MKGKGDPLSEICRHRTLELQLFQQQWTSHQTKVRYRKRSEISVNARPQTRPSCAFNPSVRIASFYRISNVLHFDRRLSVLVLQARNASWQILTRSCQVHSRMERLLFWNRTLYLRLFSQSNDDYNCDSFKGHQA